MAVCLCVLCVLCVHAVCAPPGGCPLVAPTRPSAVYCHKLGDPAAPDYGELVPPHRRGYGAMQQRGPLRLRACMPTARRPPHAGGPSHALRAYRMPARA
eukprot:COSAG01_NODE_23712_length_804_cov_1.558865_1_plen_98_part_10